MNENLTVRIAERELHRVTIPRLSENLLSLPRHDNDLHEDGDDKRSHRGDDDRDVSWNVVHVKH